MHTSYYIVTVRGEPAIVRNLKALIELIQEKGDSITDIKVGMAGGGVIPLS